MAVRCEMVEEVHSSATIHGGHNCLYLQPKCTYTVILSQQPKTEVLVWATSSKPLHGTYGHIGKMKLSSTRGLFINWGQKPFTYLRKYVCNSNFCLYAETFQKQSFKW